MELLYNNEYRILYFKKKLKKIKILKIQDEI